MCSVRFNICCVHLISWESLRNSSLIFNFKPDLPTVSLIEQDVEMGCNHGVPIRWVLFGKSGQ